MCVSVTCGGDGDGLAAVARAADVHGSDVDDVVLPGLQLQQTLAGRDRHDAPAGDTDASLPSSQTEERQRSQVSFLSGDLLVSLCCYSAGLHHCAMSHSL